MGYNVSVKPKPATQASFSNYQKSLEIRTDNYLAGPQYPAKALKRAKKEMKREQEMREATELLHQIVQKSGSREEAIQYLAGLLEKSPSEIAKYLPERKYDAIKSSEFTPEKEIEKKHSVLEKVAAVLIGAAVPAAAVHVVMDHLDKNFEKFYSVSAESGDGHARASANWTEIVKAYTELQTAMDSALADNQLTIGERGDIQQKAAGLQALQTQSLLDYLGLLGEWQIKEGGNFSVIAANLNKIINFDSPGEIWEYASCNLRDQILPARDSALQNLGVEKPVAANYPGVIRIDKSMKEMVKEHQKNDKAMDYMKATNTTPENASDSSDIGTTPLKTASPLKKLMEIIYNPAPEKSSFTEEIVQWLENPNTWDWVNGVWKENQVEVLKALRDFYVQKIQPVPYYTEVSDWAPIYNSAPVIDTFNVSKEAKTKNNYETRVNASDADKDQLSFALLKSPKGMRIDSSGKINWSPTFEDIGSHEITVQVSDPGHKVNYSYQLNVTSGNHAPVINEKDISTTALTRNSYVQQIVAEDSDGDTLSYKLISGPEGMSINNETGLISFAPTRNQTGNFSVVVEVSDGENATRVNYTLAVGSDNNLPKITSTPLLQVKVGNKWEYAVVASDKDKDPLTYELYLNDVLMHENTDGKFNWTPEKKDVGKVPYRIVVKDNYKGFSGQAGEISVIQNNPPQVPTVQKIFLEKGGQAVVSVKGTDPDMDKINYKLKQVPEGVNASIDENGNLILKGIKKGKGELKISLNDSVDEVEISVPYEVKEKIIAPDTLPYYLAAAAILSTGAAGGLYGAYRANRRNKVQQLLAIDNTGRLIGAWDEKGAPMQDKDEDILSSMLTAIKDFSKQGLGGNLEAIDYTLPIVGRPKVKFVVQGNQRMTLAAVVGTGKPKQIRRIGKSLRKAINEGSTYFTVHWDGDTASPMIYSIKDSVAKNVYGKELSFSEWLREAFGNDKEVELVPWSAPTTPALAQKPVQYQQPQQSPQEIPFVQSKPLQQNEQMRKKRETLATLLQGIEKIESEEKREQFGHEYDEIDQQFIAGKLGPEFDSKLYGLTLSVRNCYTAQKEQKTQPPQIQPPEQLQTEQRKTNLSAQQAIGETKPEESDTKMVDDIVKSLLEKSEQRKN